MSTDANKTIPTHTADTSRSDEIRFRALEARQQFLDRASQLLVSSLDQQVTLNQIAQLIVPHLADYCRIVIVDKALTIQEITVNHIDPAKMALVQELFLSYKDRSSTTHGVQRILHTGKPELISTVSQFVLEPVRDNPELLKIVNELGLKSYMGVPLIARDQIIGTITFSSIQPHRRYTQEDLSFAQELAQRIALTLDNARLYQEAQEEIKVRRKAEEALRESEARKGAVFDTALDSIITMDGKGIVVEFNPAAEKTFGYTRLEVVGQEMAELIIPPALRERHRRGLSHYLSSGEGPILDTRIEITAMRKNGTVFPIELAVTRVPSAGPPLFTGTIRDITERKEIEQRKDDFISMASHELRTPITSLKGFINILQRRLKKQQDEQAVFFLARMDAQLNKLTALVSDLLDISKMQSGKLPLRQEPFEVDELVQEIIENLQGTTHSHHLQVQGSTQAKVFGDRDRIGQVLINLFTNAIKYSQEADRVIVHLSKDLQNVTISVRDFGIGIAEDHQQKIFERFYQVTSPQDMPFSGLGIGLYISNEIVQRHHGRMWVKSSKGQGATFSFNLPLHQRES